LFICLLRVVVATDQLESQPSRIQDLDRFVFLLSDRLCPSACEKNISQYLSLRLSPKSFRSEIPSFLSLLITASCPEDPDSVSRTASRLFQLCLVELTEVSEFPEIDFALTQEQIRPTNVYRWCRETIRRNAHLERRIAEVDRLYAELNAENSSLAAETAEWTHRAGEGNRLSVQAKNEKLTARMLADMYFCIQEANRNAPPFSFPRVETSSRPFAV
jgi:hypothetical protein